MRNHCSFDEKQLWYLRLVEFGMSANLSEEQGDILMKLVDDYANAEWRKHVKVAKRWSSIKKAVGKHMTTEIPLQFTEAEEQITWPTEWRMDLWSSGRMPDLIQPQTKDVIEQIGRQLMNAELNWGWGEHIELKAYKSEDAHGVRTHGSIMSSDWAWETQSELHKKHPHGTILPIILNSDGVALGKTNRQACTALGIAGIYDDTLIEQDIAIACLNYIPTVPVPDEIIAHLMEHAHFNKTNATLAVTYFKKKLERAFWSLVLRPIREANQHGR